VGALTNLGIKTQNTRINRYRDYLEELLLDDDFDHYEIFNDTSDSPVKSDIDRLLYVLREVHELMWIVQGIEENMPIGGKGKLEEIVNGSDFSFQDANKHARNIQFELRIASYFCRNGYLVDMSQETDIIASSDKDIFFVECKRISSFKNFDAAISKALKQLNVKIRNKNEHGIIATDVTKASFDHDGLVFSTTPGHARNILQEKLSLFPKELSQLKTKTSTKNVILLWKQIHMPCLNQYPPAMTTRFSNDFVTPLKISGGEARCLKRLHKVITTTGDDDPRLVHQKRSIKDGISFKAGTKFSWDMELLETFRETLELPSKDDDYIVLNVLEDEKDTPYYFQELVFVVTNLSGEQKDLIKKSLEEAMMVLMGMLAFWRNPYED